ncbi:MAG: TonB-dependent receptor [Terriglobales bacterium]|jgi:carboxypeptidase family protein
MTNRSLTAQRTWCFAAALLAAFWLSAGIPCLAQAGRGTLAGSVKDATGAVVAGASIELKESNTGSSYDMNATADGLFNFSELPPGTYTLTVTSSGFESYIQSGIIVEVGSEASVDVVLKVGAAKESVTIMSDASHLESESSDVGYTMSPQVLESLPLPFGGEIRDPLEFAALSPGFAGTMSNNPSSPPAGAFKLSGGQQGGGDILLDGATTELASANMQVTYNFSVEAVSEFKVMTNTFDAQFGSASGGVVNLVSKQGTNDYHGSAYDLLKNRVLDANSWTNDFANAEAGKIVDTKPIDTQNDFGASVGGPVRVPWLYNGKDKTFFFFNYEGFRQENGGTSLLSAPTQAMLGGDFSALLTPMTVNGQTFPAHILYDYSTCTGANQGKACIAYPNNKITEAPDPVFAAASKVMPSAPASATGPYFNISDVSSNHEQADMWSIRMDQNIGTRNKITGSYFTGNMPYVSTQSLGSLYTGGNIQGNKYVRLGYDYFISSTMLNHFNAGFTRRRRLETSGEGGFGGNWATKFGLKGVGDAVFPKFTYNYPGNGINSPSDGQSIFYDNVFQYDDAVSWQKGRHSFRFGGEFRAAQFNLGILTGSAGQFTFSPGPTSTPTDGNSGFGFASFYRGAASQAYIDIPQVNGFRVKYFAVFAADDWKVDNKLTVNLGLRYDMPIPVTEAHDEMSYVDPTLANPGAGGLPGAYVFEGSGTGRLGGNSPQSIFKKAFGPRVGLSYSVDPKTVIRAGYGIYYSTQRIGGFAEDDSQGFSGSYTYPTPASIQTPAVVLSQITAYPGNLPPFIDPTVMNGQNNALFLESKVDRPGTIQNWTLDVQRQLPFQTIVDVAYVGAHGDHLQAFLHDPNQGNPVNQARGACLQVNIANQATSPACAGQSLVAAPYAGFSGTVSQALRPFPQYGTVTVDSATMDDPFGDYTYDAMQAQVTKRTSAGLTVLASYSWSKNITNADSEYPTEAAWEGNDNSGALNTYNLKAEKALSQFDIPQRVVLAWTYDLPFGKGKHFANQGGVVNVLAGGWKIAAVQKYQSGTPLSVTSPGWTSGIFAGGEGATGSSSRPNIVPGVNPNGVSSNSKFVYGKSLRFNPAAFTPAPNFTFGDAPKVLGERELFNTSEDFNVAKAIPMFTERVHIDFRVEFFDVFNRHRFTGFDTSITCAPTSSQSCATSGEGEGTGLAYGPRNIQGDLRVTF